MPPRGRKRSKGVGSRSVSYSHNSATTSVDKRIAELEHEKDKLNLRNPQHVRRNNLLCAEIKKLTASKAAPAGALEHMARESNVKRARSRKRLSAEENNCEIDNRKREEGEEEEEEVSCQSLSMDQEVHGDHADSKLKKRIEKLDKLMVEMIRMKEAMKKLNIELATYGDKIDERVETLRKRRHTLKTDHHERLEKMRERITNMRNLDTANYQSLNMIDKIAKENNIDTTTAATVQPDMSLSLAFLNMGVSLAKGMLFGLARIRDKYFADHAAADKTIPLDKTGSSPKENEKEL